MSPEAFLIGSAGVFAASGLAALFFPVEAGHLIGFEPSAAIAVQLAAAGLLAISTLNWIGRNAVPGGIYGRPIMLANLTFGAVFGGSLASAVIAGSIVGWGWILTGVFVLHAAAAWSVLRAPPRGLPAPTERAGGYTETQRT